jgi:citrate synthase
VSGSERPALSETINDRIQVRGCDLADELIGKVSFTEMLLLDLHGSKQSPAHVRVVDAALVAMVEHGLTPSTLAARLVLDGAPESMQGAIAAGLLATGSRFLGVIEEAAGLLQKIQLEQPIESSARACVSDLVGAGRRVPGFGHNLHEAVDPRVEALLAFAVSEGVAGPHVGSLEALEQAVGAVTGHSLMPNAAVAIAAILSDLGYRADEMRGFALVARSAGLFAHVIDERHNPVARNVWQGLHDDPGPD